MKEKNTAAESKPNELKITRIYEAPVKAVWDAWTDVNQVAQWWGPRGFSITTHSKDLRPGGHWNYTMHGPDGVDYANTTKYFEVEKYVRLVYDHGGHEDRPPLFRVTVQFSEVKATGTVLGRAASARTKMEMTMTLPTAEALQETKQIIKKANGNSTWDRLAEYLDKESTGKEDFIINRTFDAPLALMFEMWTDPQHFSKWLPPTGMTMKFLRSDIRPGGSIFYFMGDGKNVKMHGRADYRDIHPPHDDEPGRLVYAQQFCDENEKVVRHYMMPTWPETMLTTVTLTEESSKRTRVTVKWEPVEGSTQEEIETFIKAKAGMTMGWTGSFDKLEAHLLEALVS